MRLNPVLCRGLLFYGSLVQEISSADPHGLLLIGAARSVAEIDLPKLEWPEHRTMYINIFNTFLQHCKSNTPASLTFERN